MVEARLLDSAGRRRSPASLPGYHAGRSPRNKGQRYPADPPRTEEIIAVMRHAGENLHGDRVRALSVILWRAGLRIQEALSLTELDLDPRRGSVLVRRGKGGRRREIGMESGASSTSNRGCELAARCPSARCSASSTAAPADGHAMRATSSSRPARPPALTAAGACGSSISSPMTGESVGGASPLEATCHERREGPALVAQGAQALVEALEHAGRRGALDESRAFRRLS